jgi:hypothetical protein
MTPPKTDPIYPRLIEAFGGFSREDVGSPLGMTKPPESLAVAEHESPVQTAVGSPMISIRPPDAERFKAENGTLDNRWSTKTLARKLNSGLRARGYLHHSHSLSNRHGLGPRRRDSASSSRSLSLMTAN